MAFMTDAAAVLGKTEELINTKHSTSKKAGKDLDTTDFLTLMCAMFQNQDIDNTASTTDMMNQMVQISVIQAITDISTLINDTSTLTYASSLVGQTVTIGQYDGTTLNETVGTVTGTGMLNGEQVIFIGDDVYKLSDVMAVGKLPANREPVETDKPEDTTTKPTDKPETTAPTDKTETPVDKTEDAANSQNNTGNDSKTRNKTNNGEAQANPEVRMA